MFKKLFRKLFPSPDKIVDATPHEEEHDLQLIPCLTEVNSTAKDLGLSQYGVASVDPSSDRMPTTAAIVATIKRDISHIQHATFKEDSGMTDAANEIAVMLQVAPKEEAAKIAHEALYGKKSYNRDDLLDRKYKVGYKTLPMITDPFKSPSPAANRDTLDPTHMDYKSAYTREYLGEYEGKFFSQSEVDMTKRTEEFNRVWEEEVLGIIAIEPRKAEKAEKAKSKQSVIKDTLEKLFLKDDKPMLVIYNSKKSHKHPVSDVLEILINKSRKIPYGSQVFFCVNDSLELNTIKERIGVRNLTPNNIEVRKTADFLEFVENFDVRSGSQIPPVVYIHNIHEVKTQIYKGQTYLEDIITSLYSSTKLIMTMDESANGATYLVSELQRATNKSLATHLIL